MPHSSKNKKSGSSYKPDPVEEIMEELLKALWFSLFNLWYISLPLTCALYFAVKYAVDHHYHLVLLNLSDPVLFSPKNLGAIYKFVSPTTQMWTLFSLATLSILSTLGFFGRLFRSNPRSIFETVGLTNALGELPVLVKKRKMDRHRTELIIKTKGIGIDRFRNKADDLEAAFGQAVELITHGKNQAFVRIILTKTKLPARVSFGDVEESTRLPLESFYIGQSLEGVLTEKIQDLPHMLISGATGSGKSVFFKQVLLGLMKSSPHLQLYLLDLKDGLEMRDFIAAPNVRMVKTLTEAVLLLEQLENLMRERFKFMEEKNLKSIVPARDQKDRIIVSIDESSVLFSTLSKEDQDYRLTQKARKHLDTLAKLSRAAGINLILATQKLEKQVIPTTVSENIAARMAFKANSLAGSLLVTGGKDALDLPDIKGRGVWCLGAKRIVVQTPYITEKEIVSQCQKLSESAAKGAEMCFGPMLDLTPKRAPEETKLQKMSLPVQTPPKEPL